MEIKLNQTTEEVTVENIEIPSYGFPGGSPKQVEKDYEIAVEENPNGTFSVTGHLNYVKAYLDDYGLSHLL